MTDQPRAAGDPTHAASDEVAQGRDPARPPWGGRHRRTLIMAGAVLAFLVVVAVVGLVRGTPAPRPTTSTSPPTATATDTSERTPLELAGVRCAKLDGDRLTVGFEVANRGPDPFVISELEPSFPLGGLTPDADAAPDTSSCPGPATGVPYLLGEGQQALLAFVVTTADPRCVGPLVVDVQVDYGSGDDVAHTDVLHAFPDLGGFDLPSQC